MSNPPRITVVTPSFNQGRYLESTMRSVIDQDYPNLEYLVIDGGSDDGSFEIIRKYQGYLAGWVSEPDRGQAHAINKGLEMSTGHILGWLNSDDRLEPGALYKIAEYAEGHPEDSVMVGHGRKVDPSGRVVYYKHPGDLTFEGLCKWLDGGNFMQPSCYFRRTAWERVGPLNEAIPIALDVEYWLRMIQTERFGRIEHLLSTAMHHDEAKTGPGNRHRMVVDCAVVVIKAGGEAYVRRHLDGMADRLEYLESLTKKISKNRAYRLTRHLSNRLFGL